MLKIYHNNRCSKSRQGLAILQNAGKDFEIINYLENPPSEKELKSILKKLAIKPIELVRKNEQIWKDNYKGKSLTDEDIIKAMCKHPKLIERPIVVSRDRAALGRPPENIKTLL